MSRIVVHSHVGPDGFVDLRVPLGAAKAGRDVIVTIEEVMPAKRDDWRRFVDETAGSWQGELERPEQGDFERRADWP